ncbi:alpha/beta hydrolase [Stratiformator vulcanicus]|uniref:Thioesterase domain protein n=1 Tax=Stratiformator vulcanicus TaxID=2527980 RepID=A0A517R788_9PLAN|nr:alpha/beta hydrolase [Stratiformator vulcanicus]QDT39745.1 hypothetical protein Pan189_41540 [Stratiformator vulcanicus]
MSDQSATVEQVLPQAPSPKRVSTHVVCITGFLQRHGSPYSGIFGIWRKLLGHADAVRFLPHLMFWNSRFRDVADTILTFRNGCDLRVVIIGYSWGAGYGAMKLAEQLRRRGVTVDAMVLCDPVYRSRLFATRWLALVGELPISGWRPRIRVPDNVSRVMYWRQTMAMPRGHQLVAADPEVTKIDDRGLLDADHVNVDNHPTFVNAAVEVALEYRPPPE